MKNETPFHSDPDVTHHISDVTDMTVRNLLLLLSEMNPGYREQLDALGNSHTESIATILRQQKEVTLTGGMGIHRRLSRWINEMPKVGFTVDSGESPYCIKARLDRLFETFADNRVRITIDDFFRLIDSVFTFDPQPRKSEWYSTGSEYERRTQFGINLSKEIPEFDKLDYEQRKEKLGFSFERVKVRTSNWNVVPEVYTYLYPTVRIVLTTDAVPLPIDFQEEVEFTFKFAERKASVAITDKFESAKGTFDLDGRTTEIPLSLCTKIINTLISIAVPADESSGVAAGELSLKYILDKDARVNRIFHTCKLASFDIHQDIENGVEIKELIKTEENPIVVLRNWVTAQYSPMGDGNCLVTFKETSKEVRVYYCSGNYILTVTMPRNASSFPPTFDFYELRREWKSRVNDASNGDFYHRRDILDIPITEFNRMCGALYRFIHPEGKPQDSD